MRTRFSTTYETTLSLLILLLNVLILSCAPTILPLPTPPENYKGPVAERPIMQQGDYWVFERGNATRVKSTELASNIGFPVWIGKTWSYDVQMIRAGQSPTSNTPRISARADCYVVDFKQVTVTAGTFGAFECECQCVHSSAMYEPGCGNWTIWYAPEVKNIIRTKTGSTETSVELVEYRASRAPPRAKGAPEKVTVPPKPNFELSIPSLNAAVARGEGAEATTFYETKAREAEKRALTSIRG